jgi:hypothetical protein
MMTCDKDEIPTEIRNPTSWNFFRRSLFTMTPMQAHAILLQIRVKEPHIVKMRMAAVDKTIIKTTVDVTIHRV